MHRFRTSLLTMALRIAMAFVMMSTPLVTIRAGMAIPRPVSMDVRLLTIDAQALSSIAAWFPFSQAARSNQGLMDPDVRAVRRSASVLGESAAKTAHRWEWLFQVPVVLQLLIHGKHIASWHTTEQSLLVGVASVVSFVVAHYGRSQDEKRVLGVFGLALLGATTLPVILLQLLPLIHGPQVSPTALWLAAITGILWNMALHQDYNVMVLTSGTYPAWFSRTFLNLIPVRLRSPAPPTASIADLPGLENRLHALFTIHRRKQSWANVGELKTLQAFQSHPDDVTLQAEALEILNRLDRKSAAWNAGDRSLENLPMIVVSFINYSLHRDASNAELEAPIDIQKLAHFYDRSWDQKENHVKERIILNYQGTIWREHHFYLLKSGANVKALIRPLLRRFTLDVVEKYLSEIQHTPRVTLRPVPRPLPLRPRSEEFLASLPLPPEKREAQRPAQTEPAKIVIERLRHVTVQDTRLRQFALPEELERIAEITEKSGSLALLRKRPELSAPYEAIATTIEQRALRWSQGDYAIANAPAAVRAFINYAGGTAALTNVNGLQALPQLITILTVCAQFDAALLGFDNANTGIESRLRFLFQRLAGADRDYFPGVRTLPALQGLDRIYDFLRMRYDIYVVLNYYVAHHEQDILNLEQKAAAARAAQASEVGKRGVDESQQKGFRYLASFDDESLGGRDRQALEYLAGIYYRKSTSSPELTAELLFEIYDELDRLAQSNVWPNESIAASLDRHPHQLGSVMDFLLQRGRLENITFGDYARSVQQTLQDLATPEDSQATTERIAGFLNHADGAIRFATFSEWFFLTHNLRRYSVRGSLWPVSTLQMSADILNRIEVRDAAWESGTRRIHDLPAGSVAFVRFVLNYKSVRNPFPSPAYYGRPISQVELQAFHTIAVDHWGHVAVEWKDRFVNALRTHGSNPWVADLVRTAESTRGERFSADLESLIQAEREDQELKDLIAAESAPRDMSAAQEEHFSDLSAHAIDLLWRVTQHEPGAREEASQRLASVFGVSVISLFLNYVENLNEPIESLQDFASNPIPDIALQKNIDRITVALGVPNDARRRIQADFPTEFNQFTVSNWEVLVHLFNLGIHDLAFLRMQVPQLLGLSPYGMLEPRLNLLKTLHISVGEEAHALVSLIQTDDLDSLQLVREMSETPLSLQALFDQFHALSAPVVPPAMVTEVELDHAVQALDQWKLAFEVGGAAQNQGRYAEARKHFNEAFLGLGQLARTAEGVVEQSMIAGHDLPRQDEWLDLYSNASGLQESVALMLQSIPTPVDTSAIEEDITAEVSRVHAVPGEVVTLRSNKGEEYTVYINKNYSYFDTALFKRFKDEIIERLLFYIDNPNHVSFQESGPMSNVRRIKVEGSQYRVYAHILEPNTILIHAFGTTARFKVDGMSLKKDFKDEMGRRNDWRRVGDVHSISLEPWIYPNTTGSGSQHFTHKGESPVLGMAS